MITFFCFIVSLTVRAAPAPGLYRGPDDFRLLVRELTWMGRPRLFRFDFVAGPSVRGSVVIDFPESGDAPWDLAKRVRLPHAAPVRLADGRRRRELIRIYEVDLGRLGYGEVDMFLSPAGHITDFTYRITRPRSPGPARAGVTCALALDPRFSN